MLTLPKRWMGLRTPEKQKITREASTSMEDLTNRLPSAPGAVIRPKSMCVPELTIYSQINEEINEPNRNYCSSDNFMKLDNNKYFETHRVDNINLNEQVKSHNINRRNNATIGNILQRFNRQPNVQSSNENKPRARRNPVQRAASRLYRAGIEAPKFHGVSLQNRDCVGPEFVVRAALPRKEIIMSDVKGNGKKIVTVIMLDGQKIDVTCNPSTTTAGQLFEVSINCYFQYFCFLNKIL